MTWYHIRYINHLFRRTKTSKEKNGDSPCYKGLSPFYDQNFDHFYYAEIYNFSN